MPELLSRSHIQGSIRENGASHLITASMRLPTFFACRSFLRHCDTGWKREENKISQIKAKALIASAKRKEKKKLVGFNHSGAKDDAEHDGDDAENQHDDAEAPPFQPAGTACVLDALGQLHVSGFGVVLDLLGVLLGLLDLGVLQDDCGC